MLAMTSRHRGIFPFAYAIEEACFRGTRKPARETRALPDLQIPSFVSAPVTIKFVFASCHF
ncbi:MAG: hypothetical protein DMF23_15270 [Verrucomicrobia bacterium]|nr:MAG: hypothetical protein DMF23_15270 [Verrucomicrobiota bacterium]